MSLITIDDGAPQMTNENRIAGYKAAFPQTTPGSAKVMAPADREMLNARRRDPRNDRNQAEYDPQYAADTLALAKALHDHK